VIHGRSQATVKLEYGVIFMVSLRSRMMRITAVVLMALVMVVPVNISFGENPSAADTSDRAAPDQAPSSREYDMDSSEIATRSAPWLEWERFSYHSGGEDGALFYDSDEDMVYAFGGGYTGQQGTNSYDDFFKFDLNEGKWINVPYSYGPMGRYQCSYACDETTGKYYVYGGYQSGTMLNDLWVFDSGTQTWSQPKSSLLGIQRVRSPMVVDRVNQKLYLHMGQGDAFTQGSSNLSGFFEIDIQANFAVTALTNDGREAGMELRYSHDMCIDEVNQIIYMWGGYHRINRWQGFYLKELWGYGIQNETWFRIRLPAGIGEKSEAKVFFRPYDGTVNIWGGRNGSEWSRDERLWTYNPVTDEWTVIDLTNEISGRDRYARYYSFDDDRYVIFAGRTGDRENTVHYLDMPTHSWTSYPEERRSSTNQNGILAHDRTRGRLYYIGPSINSGWGGNDTAYYYYFDLLTEKWVGPIWNNGNDDPISRDWPGMCYVPDENAVYMYGGEYQTGNWQNRRYWNTADLWRIDLDTNTWEKIYEVAGPGERSRFDMVYNEVDKKIYFYGGCKYKVETSSDVDVFDDFFSFDPAGRSFQRIQITPNPGKIWGAGVVIEDRDHEMYLFGGWLEKDTNPDYDDEMWKYNFSTRKWTQLPWNTNPSTRAFVEMDYDPVTHEIIMTGGGSGGGSNDVFRYRILENSYSSDLYLLPNPGSLYGHGSVFIVETRDLWVYGGGGEHGIWRLGIPPRLSIQEAVLTDGDEEGGVAYAMKRPYTFRTTVKTVNGPADLNEVVMDIAHSGTFGKLQIRFNNTDSSFREVDPADYAEVVDSSYSWDGIYLTLQAKVMFHWNWSTPSNYYNRIFKVMASGNDIIGDSVLIRDFLVVRNTLSHVGELVVRSDLRGRLENGSWVQADERITFTGPVIVYSGTEDVYPSQGSFTVNLWDDNDNVRQMQPAEGEPINLSMVSPESSQEDVDYTFNLTGIPAENDELSLGFVLNTDGTSPLPPEELKIIGDINSVTPNTRFDNDTEVSVEWNSIIDSGSGIKGYYWSYEDNGGSSDGTWVNETKFLLDLPSNGTHTVYVWAEDNVGNIGPSSNASIMVDTEPIVFRVVSPNIDNLIPYLEIEITFNLTDLGGSKIRPYFVEYRYTTYGLNDQEDWVKESAWKVVPDAQFMDPSTYFEFTLPLSGLTEGVDNYIQIKAQDRAGSVFESEIYNIQVDTSLKYPDVTLIHPEDNAEFETPEGIGFNWSVDFFLPEDVKYYLLVSREKELIQQYLDKESNPLEPPSDDVVRRVLTVLEFSPDWLTFGDYYWTVIPVAKDKWIGNCTTGLRKLSITSEDNYRISARVDDDYLGYIRGKNYPFMTFTVDNEGQQDAIVSIDYALRDGITVSWNLQPNYEDRYRIIVGGKLEIIGTLTIDDSVPASNNYTLYFYFNTTMGVKRTIPITLEVKESQEIGGEDEEKDNTATIAIIVVAVIVVLMLILGLVYFLVIKKKDKEKKPAYGSFTNFEEMEKEMGLDNKSAPVPVGLRKPLPQKKTGEGVTSGEVKPEAEKPELALPGEGEQGPPTLAEEGSEDEWMNLVAKETLESETVEDTIEVDDHLVTGSTADTGKTLEDILAEMEENID